MRDLYFLGAITPDLTKVNASRIQGARAVPKIWSSADDTIVTTDFFGFDTSDNHFKLQGLGDVSEMGDAVLGMVAQELGTQAPAWIAIRNVSDPQIKAEGGMTINQEGDLADKIYKAYGRWSSVCSAVVCWAAVAAL